MPGKIVGRDHRRAAAKVESPRLFLPRIRLVRIRLPGE
jgi:hypothetical protein